jgi:Tetratricopeptide repeat
MVSTRVLQNLCLAAGLVLFINPAGADTVTVIMQGNVVMPDGSPPPKIAGIERVCTDLQGSAPGPITDKSGHYLWTQRVDLFDTRVCYIQATLPGFISSRIDVSNLNITAVSGGSNEMKLPDLILSPHDSGDASSLVLVADSEVPGKAKAPYKAAIKAMDADNMAEGIKQLQVAVAAAPKFADGWNILGAVYERQKMFMEAREALQHALEANPKLVSPYLRIARISNRLGDWDAAAKAEDALLKIEKRYYPEIYLQQAITRAELKDYSGAEESAKTALSLDPKHQHLNRAEYVLGRMALAKGDVAGAKAHIANYVGLDPAAQDLGNIQIQLESLENPEVKAPNITLMRP